MATTISFKQDFQNLTSSILGDTFTFKFDGDYLIKSVETPTLTSSFNADLKLTFRWSDDKVNYSDWSDSFANIKQANLIEGKIERLTSNGNIIQITNVSFTAQTDIANAPNCYLTNQTVNKFCDPKLGVILNCDANLFRPSEMVNPMGNLFAALSNSVAEMFGWTVKYFKVEVEPKSKDVILHEYTLFNVSNVKDVRVLVPENKLPSEELRFTAFDMDFVDDFEVHVTREHFERAFGVGTRPNEKDYIYFPLLNRVWEVTSTYLSKGDFLQTPVYWKLKLFKYQERQNIKKSDAIAQAMDSLIARPNFLEFEDEVNRSVIPSQLDNSISLLGKDAIRSHINPDLEIEDLQLEINFSKLSRFAYNLKSIKENEIAVVYSPMLPTANLSVSGWFSGKGSILAGNNFTLSYNGSKMAMVTNVGEFEFNIVLNTSLYYGFVLDCHSKFNQVSLRIWKLTNLGRTNKIELLFREVKSVDLNGLNLISPLKLIGSNITLTNLRVWKNLIPEENQAIILNEYSIKDGHNCIICDNCLRPFVESQFAMR